MSNEMRGACAEIWRDKDGWRWREIGTGRRDLEPLASAEEAAMDYERARAAERPTLPAGFTAVPTSELEALRAACAVEARCYGDTANSVDLRDALRAILANIPAKLDHVAVLRRRLATLCRSAEVSDGPERAALREAIEALEAKQVTP